MKQVFEALGKYYREIRVHLLQSVCMECQSRKKCLYFDSSNDEYSAMIFCKGCLEKFMEGEVSKSTLSRDLSGED